MVKIKAARVPGSKNKKKFKGKKVATTPKRGSKVMLKRKFKSSGKGTAGSQVKGSDARLKIISRSRSNIVDARDKLVSLAKGSDARQKLVKIRNLKEGKVSYITQDLLKIQLIIVWSPNYSFQSDYYILLLQLDVKTTAGGAITITKTTKGQVVLTTKKKATPGSPKKLTNTSMQATNLPGQKNVRRNVGQGGVVSLSTKPKQESTFKSTVRGRGSTLSRNNGAQARSGSTVGGRPVQMARDRAARNEIQLSPRKLTRTIKGELSDAAKLDMELLNTRVNPVSNVKSAVLVSCCQLKLSPPILLRIV